MSGYHAPDSAPTSSPTSHPAFDPEQQLAVLPPPARDVAHHPYPTSSMAAIVKGIDLTDSPPYARSLNSTASNSPRM